MFSTFLLKNKRLHKQKKPSGIIEHRSACRMATRHVKQAEQLDRRRRFSIDRRMINLYFDIIWSLTTIDIDVEIKYSLRIADIRSRKN